MTQPHGFGLEILAPELVALRAKAWQAMRPKPTRTHRGFLMRAASDPVLAMAAAPATISAVPIFSHKPIRRR